MPFAISHSLEWGAGAVTARHCDAHVTFSLIQSGLFLWKRPGPLGAPNFSRGAVLRKACQKAPRAGQAELQRRRPERDVLRMGKDKRAYCLNPEAERRARTGTPVWLPRCQRPRRDTHPDARWGRGPPPCSADGAGTETTSYICGPQRRRPSPVTSWRGKGPYSDTASCLRAATGTH